MARCFLLLLPAFLLSLPAASLADQALIRAAAESNVNQQYTIESISIAGIKVEEAKLPVLLRSRFSAMVGERCDVARLEDLAGELRRELNLRAVSQRLLRGSEPGRVRVNFEVVRREVSFDLSVPSIRYNSEQQWSGELTAKARLGQSTLSAAAVTDGDDSVERFSGINARFEQAKVGSERIGLQLGVESYVTGRVDYRSRRNVAPQVTYSVARPLTVSAGLSFEQMRLPAGASHAADLAANAVTFGVRYARQFEGAQAQQKLDTRYDLRTASEALGSDFAYTRHTITARYDIRCGRATVSDDLVAGGITGSAPAFERFVLGSHFAPDSLGGTRVIHNVATGGYQFGDRTAELFYDSGSLGHGARHSAGIAYRQGIFVVAMAFPLSDGRVIPIFMAGLNY